MPRVKSFSRTGRGNNNRNPSSAAKKITIKPFSQPPTLPPNYYEETSRPLLQHTQDAIFDNMNNGAWSLQNSYTSVVQLVSHQFGPRLYRDLICAMQQAAERVLPAGGSGSSSSSGKSGAHYLLSHVQTQYQRYVEYIVLCQHVFLPLDRTHVWWTTQECAVKRSHHHHHAATTTTTSSSVQDNHHHHNRSSSSSTTLSLWEVGLQQFVKRLETLELDTVLYDEWWNALQQHWEESSSASSMSGTTSLLQSTWHMWQDLQVLSHWLPKLQEQLQSFLTDLSKKWQNNNNSYAVAFIQYVHDKWLFVNRHWSTFLPKSWLRSMLELHLLLPHLNEDWLFRPKCVTEWLLQNNDDDMALKLWMLALRIPKDKQHASGPQLVAQALAQYAKSQGQYILSWKNNTSNHNAIAQLLQLQNKMTKLQQRLPHSTEYLQQPLKQVWEQVINNPVAPPAEDAAASKNNKNSRLHAEMPPSIAEQLAKYLDGVFRSTKKLEEVDMEQVIGGIFVPLQAKDVLEAFYKKDLAKRLLWNRSVDMDAERRFVSLLKAECGAAYTSKMEGMFQDVEWSRETMTRYKQQQQQHSSLSSSSGVEMEAQVLTTGYWPVYPQYPHLILPPNLLEPQEAFANHYKTKYQGRRMTWQYALGHCTVRGQYPHKSYEFIVSLCQALVLIQFNNNDKKWTIRMLMQATGLDDRDEMERILQSLSLGKEGTRVLKKIDHDATTKRKIRASVHDEDEFVAQASFESHLRKIRINNILWKETKEERSKTVEAISRDRLYLIDAVLVRILKARKTITHAQLIPQVLEQIKVPAQSADVKKRIESLIEREYMERDGKDRNRYNYLA